MAIDHDSPTYQSGTTGQIASLRPWFACSYDPPWTVCAERPDLFNDIGTTDSGYAEGEVSIDDSLESLNRIIGLCPLCTCCAQASLVNAPTSSIASEV